jgi:glycosyltransferase involved in cell wall biosynthesis
MSLTTSVVLCTYNGARYLPAQWASVLAQSQLPDEIVVRDDASTDATPELLTRLAVDAEARGVAVRRLQSDSNLGYIANFEVALRAASSDVLLLCDQDDVWRHGKLATLAAHFESRPGLLLTCSDARRIDEAGSCLRRSLFDVLKISRAELRRIHAGEGFRALLRRSLATGATIALRRSLLVDALPVPQDWVHDEWLAIIAAALGGFDCCEQPLIDYRQHGGNQIGMPDRDLAMKWHDLVKPRAALIDMLIARDVALDKRLGTLGDRVAAADRWRTLEKLRHLRARQTMAGALGGRVGTVFRELVSGRYRRYASGWRSAVRDLMRRG